MPIKDRLWTPRFIILWQSQLVSTAGDAVYGIALGFWVLSQTGSTALMGALMAASTLPGVLAAPFAGVIIDRTNKKRLLVLMDMLRAAAVVLLAAAAYSGLIRVWMVFIAGVLLSLCGAVFSPCLQASIPEIAPASKMAQATSAMSAVYTGSNLLGYTGGGFLYQILGAPALFLINGLSFLFSGLSLPFVRLSKTGVSAKIRFFEDMANGFSFIARQAGLRITVIIAALSNFFFVTAFTLFIPLCKYTPGLGAGRYGILMACFTGGGLIGYAILSAVTIRAKNRFLVFTVATLMQDVLLIIFINQPYFIVMAAMLIIAGIMNAVFNVILVSTVQLSTPQSLRGKVMSFVNMTSAGLTPFAMALGGVLGQVLPVKAVITAAFMLSLAVTIPIYFSRKFKAYITTEYPC
jgi:MFS family permease